MPNITRFENSFLMKSINDYFEILSEIKKKSAGNKLWYRGQMESSWNLVPNLFRYSKKVDLRGDYIDLPTLSNSYYMKYPNSYRELSIFKDELQKNIENKNVLPTNDFDLMCIGQHYGLLTPLLDFSTDPLIGLFFSVDGAKQTPCNELSACEDEFRQTQFVLDSATVFVLLPEKFNNVATCFQCEDGQPLSCIHYNEANESKLKGYVTRKNNDVPLTPLCFIAPKDDYRIIRQSGNFICYGYDTRGINEYPNCNEFLYRIFIPHCIFSQIQDFLELIDITHESVYGTYTSPYTEVAKKAANEIIKKH